MTFGYWSTVAFMIATTLTIAIYDIFAAVHWGYEDTISDITRRWNQYHPWVAPVLAVGMGLLFGHLFPAGTTLHHKLLAWVICIVLFALSRLAGQQFLP